MAHDSTKKVIEDVMREECAGTAAAEAEAGAQEVDPLLSRIGTAIGLSDEEIAEEVRKMLDGEDRPKNPAHLPPAEGFEFVTTPESVAKGLKGKKMIGYAVVLVNEDFQSVVAINIAHGLPSELRSTVMDVTVTALELAKLRILMGSV